MFTLRYNSNNCTTALQEMHQQCWFGSNPTFYWLKRQWKHRMEPLQKHWDKRELLLFYSMADTEAPSSWTRLIQWAHVQVQPLLSASGRSASWRNGLVSLRTDVARKILVSWFSPMAEIHILKGLAYDIITCHTRFPYGSQLSSSLTNIHSSSQKSSPGSY